MVGFPLLAPCYFSVLFAGAGASLITAQSCVLSLAPLHSRAVCERQAPSPPPSARPVEQGCPQPSGDVAKVLRWVLPRGTAAQGSLCAHQQAVHSCPFTVCGSCLAPTLTAAHLHAPGLGSAQQCHLGDCRAGPRPPGWESIVLGSPHLSVLQRLPSSRTACDRDVRAVSSAVFSISCCRSQASGDAQ